MYEIPFMLLNKTLKTKIILNCILNIKRINFTKSFNFHMGQCTNHVDKRGTGELKFLKILSETSLPQTANFFPKNQFYIILDYTNGTMCIICLNKVPPPPAHLSKCQCI